MVPTLDSSETTASSTPTTVTPTTTAAPITSEAPTTTELSTTTSSTAAADSAPPELQGAWQTDLGFGDLVTLTLEGRSDQVDDPQ